ncbi:MAG: pilus assembly PilX N-terminal domain-containing protein [Sedimentisphaerales bacterium]|nr:pilus assembly PilX N-terminal domain-containing protein [Sedimentisphaerales bacterium]
MKLGKRSFYLRRRGFALILSMIFVLVFSALAISMATISGTNIQVADNLCNANRARASAESGIEILRFWLSNVSISGNTPESLRFTEIISSLSSYIAANSSAQVQCAGGAIMIPSVTLDAENTCAFSATIHQIDLDTLQLNVTGVCDSFSRTISVNYVFSQRANNVFDFGVATRGPLSLAGNIELDGVNVSVDASVYIESENSNLALSIIGNSQIAGDVKVVNALANVDLQGGQAGIGGETGADAIANHVEFGVTPSEFPEPTPSQFESFIINTIDASTNTTADATFDNVRILAGTNPTFTGHVTLRGIVFVETPNVVTFTGNTDVMGIIVGDGSIADNSGVNRICFSGDVHSDAVTSLPYEAQFEELHDKTGTFLMAPGFHISFGGSFDTLSGAIAGNGIEFFGNAGGTINGSIINYSDEEMTLSGNSDLYFNRSGIEKAPAGFVPEIILQYDPESYSEM